MPITHLRLTHSSSPPHVERREASTISMISTLIHAGDSIHHHDTLILPSSFNVMNMMISSPIKLMPLLVELELLIRRTHTCSYRNSSRVVTSAISSSEG